MPFFKKNYTKIEMKHVITRFECDGSLYFLLRLFQAAFFQQYHPLHIVLISHPGKKPQCFICIIQHLINITDSNVIFHKRDIDSIYVRHVRQVNGTLCFLQLVVCLREAVCIYIGKAKIVMRSLQTGGFLDTVTP
jgi:hypothetical protein